MLEGASGRLVEGALSAEISTGGSQRALSTSDLVRNPSEPPAGESSSQRHISPGVRYEP